MTPIYASNRAKIAGWYAFLIPDDSTRRVFWDGGVGKRMSGATGFWCPYTGNIVDAPDSLLKAMPNVCMDGYLTDDEVIVTGLPKVEDFVGVVVDAFTEETRYIYDEPGLRASFIDEIAYGNELFNGGPCRMVQVEKLPDDPHVALDRFRENYMNGLVRHPLSAWTPYRSCRMMGNVTTKPVKTGRVREIVINEDQNFIEFINVWATVEKEMKVTPLYEGDENPDCPLWKIKSPITLYCVEELVIGYE